MLVINFNAYFGYFDKILQYSILFRINCLLFRSFPNSSQISWVWVHINFWQVRHNIGAFLYKLHENEILWQKLTLLYGPIRAPCNFIMLHYAVHIKIRNEIKN